MYHHMLISPFEIGDTQWDNTVNLIGGYQHHGKFDYNYIHAFQI